MFTSVICTTLDFYYYPLSFILFISSLIPNLSFPVPSFFYLLPSFLLICLQSLIHSPPLSTTHFTSSCNHSGCRVIARLMRERDEARAMLASATASMTVAQPSVAATRCVRHALCTYVLCCMLMCCVITCYVLTCCVLTCFVMFLCAACHAHTAYHAIA
jgi:hypothetical protein